TPRRALWPRRHSTSQLPTTAGRQRARAPAHRAPEPPPNARSTRAFGWSERRGPCCSEAKAEHPTKTAAKRSWRRRMRGHGGLLPLLNKFVVTRTDTWESPSVTGELTNRDYFSSSASRACDALLDEVGRQRAGIDRAGLGTSPR